jgi:hypothetical protein
MFGAGKVRLKLFWGGVYTGKGMTPIQRIYALGRLVLAKVVYSKYSPFSQEYYRTDVLDLLRKHYDVRWEKSSVGQMWHYVYSWIDGGQIGRPEDAYRYLQRGLTEIQKADAKHKVCSIGFHPESQKWVGWSHRAMCGFGVGDVVSEGDCTASSGWTEEYLQEHPEEDRSLPVGFKAENLEDAKRMAVAFAESVS